MIIENPSPARIPALRALWQQSFGDPDTFLDHFFEAGFSQKRCRCVVLDGQIAAALYWFDCTLAGSCFAYLYAVATAPTHRGKGLCRALLEDTHAYLQAAGYSGTVLVPGADSLFRFYEKTGYRTFCHVREFTCNAAGAPVRLRSAAPEVYASLRKKLLPAGSLLQEGETLTFLSRYSRFYAGNDFLLAATLEQGMLTAHEYLGDPTLAPGILSALGAAQGCFRIPGTEKPFAMFRPLGNYASVPTYLGLALD